MKQDGSNWKMGARGRWAGVSKVVLLSAALLSPGCVSEKPSAEPPPDISKYIVDKLPDNFTPLKVNFDDKIVLEGVQIEPGLEVAPGKRVKMTMYWRVDKALDAPDWKLFTHVLDASGDRLLNIDNVGPLRQGKRNGQTWPPSSWSAGKIYVDTQTFTMPRKVKGTSVQLVTGIWKGKERLPIKSGPAISERRALVATFKTTPGDSKTTRVPRLEVPELAKAAAIRIDGKLDDAAWEKAASTGPFVNVKSGEPMPESPVQGSAKLLWDDKWLYLGFDVKDADVVGGFDAKAKDPQLWTKDCVEIMIDPDGNGDNKDYYEIQVNPQNLVFDSQFDKYNSPREEPDGPFGHQDWTAKLDSAVQIKGSLDNSSDKDEGYVVELRIPWSSFDKAKELPPKPGANWRINLYAMQNNSGVAWSPILDQGNFHKASRFGRVSFVTAASKEAAGGEAAASASASDKKSLTVSKKALQKAPAPAPSSVESSAPKTRQPAAPPPAQPNAPAPPAPAAEPTTAPASAPEPAPAR